MKYVIDFLNGVREEFEGSLEAAKEMADDMAGYTQQDYVILWRRRQRDCPAPLVWRSL